MRVRRAFLALFIGVLTATAAFAQNGGIRVRVFDGSDKTPMIGAIVALSNTQKLVADTSQMTDASGLAYFPVLRAGSGYVVEAFADGYGRVRVDARVKIGEVLDLPIYLNPQQQETVTVIGKKATVDLESTTTSTKYGEEFLTDLPISGRFYQNALTLAPGVQDADGDGNPNVHGARDRDFKASVGGISNQDPLSGQWLSYVNSDSIEEIEMVTAGAGAEFGRAQGGFATIIQKQGSNDREGVFSATYSSSKLESRGSSGTPSERLPKYDNYEPAISLTGPFVKDKLWYALNVDYKRENRPQALGSGQVPVISTRLTTYDGRVTWQVSPKNKMALQYRYDPLTVENAGVSDFTPVESSQRISRGAPTWTLEWVAPYSPKLLVDSIVGYQDFSLDIEPTTRGVPNNCASGNIPIVARSQCFNIDTGEVSGSAILEYHDSRQRLTLYSHGEWFAGRWLGAEHQIKFGVDAENERYFRSQTRRPDTNFFIVRPSGDQPPRPGRPPLEDVAVVQATFALPESSSARATGTNWAVYFQDQIRPLNNLTINASLRLSREEINAGGFQQFDPEAEWNNFYTAYQANPSLGGLYFQQSFTAYEGLGSYPQEVYQYLGSNVSLNPAGIQGTFWSNTRRPTNINLSNTNFEPRMSVKWDPFNDGKTSFYATAGRYYDKIFLAVPLIESEPVTTTVVFDAVQVGDEWQVLGTNTPLNPALNTSMVDRNLRTPYKDEFTIGFEREIMQETVLRVKVIRSRFRDQLQDIDLNKIPGDYGRCVVMSRVDEPWIVRSDGSAANPIDYVDPFTGETWTDSTDGPGDGRIDDCAGKLQVIDRDLSTQAGRNLLVYRPDGIADLYILNPAWGNVYLVGNFNSQKYSGVEVQLQRRNYKNWEMEASYTWSRAIGDAEDFQLALGDDRSTLQDERGYLSYDQRHVVKVNATTLTPWGVHLGTRITWQSGLPYSLLRRDFSFSTTPPIYTGFSPPDSPVRTTYITSQRNDQRNRAAWNFDVKATKEFPLPRGMNAQVNAQIFNLLNDGTYLIYNDNLNLGQQVNGRNEAKRVDPRRFELSMRLSF